MATTQSKNGKRFDEEFKREVAALASRPGATDEQVGRDLGVSAWSVARWRRRFGIDKRSGARTAAATTAANAPATGSANVPELERQIKALQREVADLREQRSILKKQLPSSRRPRDEDRRDQKSGGAAQRAKTLPHPGRGA